MAEDSVEGDHESIYSNAPVPEGINYQPTSHLREFLYLLAGLGALTAALTLVTYLAFSQFGRYIPFSWENRLFGSWIQTESSSWPNRQSYLDDLADRMAAHMGLPSGMDLQVNLLESEEVNAMAGLDGQIYLLKGLLDQVESENELAFVLAHEIAHVRERHPIQRLGSGLVIGSAIALVSAGSGVDLSAVAVGSAMTGASFSRAQESEADRLAAEALLAEYGHLEGAGDFFRRMQSQAGDSSTLLIRTHPGLQSRINYLDSLASRYPREGENGLVALPVQFQTEKR